MFFDRIVLFNMFSYRGKQVFDLSRPTGDSDKEIVLIHGDNGNGKTSFLRCMKLLFCGISDSLRAEVRPGERLGYNDFVKGNGTDWDGILNRAARENRCYISVEWVDNLQRIIATREWNLNQILNAQTLHGALTIEIKDEQQGETKIIEGIQAKHFLDRILPAAFIPFFFFDGEQISSLAQARSKEESEKIESLLKIAPIKSVGEALKKIRSGLQPLVFDPATSQEIDGINSRLNALVQEENHEKEMIRDLNFEEERLQNEIQDKEAERAAYFASFSKSESDHLFADLKNLKKNIAQARETFIFQFSPDLPLVANRTLVDRCILELQAGENQQAAAQVELLDYLVKVLPPRIVNEPPGSRYQLHEETQDHFEKKTKDLLNEEKQIRKGKDGLLSLSPKDASKVLAEMVRYQDPEKPRTRQHNLKELSDDLEELTRLEDKLSDTSEFEQSQRKAFELLNEELGELKGQIAVVREDLKRLREHGRKQERNRERESLERNKSLLFQKVAKTKKDAKKYGLIRELLELFENYRRQLKVLSQESLEQAVQEKWRLLAPAFKVIHDIKINSDTFTWEFYDSEGKPVGRGSISAGMKQLFATSLLWALKEVSGKEIPPVIDTPLGRLDETNRRALLTRYYPNVGEQVIILPTDSEISPDNYAELKKHVYKEFKLVNETKIATEVKPDAPMHGGLKHGNPEKISTTP